MRTTRHSGEESREKKKKRKKSVGKQSDAVLHLPLLLTCFSDILHSSHLIQSRALAHSCADIQYAAHPQCSRNEEERNFAPLPFSFCCSGPGRPSTTLGEGRDASMRESQPWRRQASAGGLPIAERAHYNVPEPIVHSCSGVTPAVARCMSNAFPHLCRPCSLVTNLAAPVVYIGSKDWVHVLKCSPPRNRTGQHGCVPRTHEKSETARPSAAGAAELPSC